MATKGKGATPSRKTSVPVGNFPIPPISMDADRSGKQDWENVVGWIAACILVILLLPILGMLYMDVLQTRNEAQEQVQKVEKLRRQIEQKEREKEK
jgi:flagellar biosynthesis/type III secretory pathway M-ring protein FliF/YscJ